MPVLEIKNMNNVAVDQVDLREDVFGAPLKETLIWEAVRHYMACGRRGTHATKGRGDVSGSNIKPWRQKGTGRARAGQTRNPVWRHGGTVFGPQPRDYSYNFPKKKRKGALISALSEKLRKNQIMVVDELGMSSHKTKDMVKALGTLEIAGKVLIVDSLDNAKAILSSRNLQKVTFVPSTGVNIYDVLNHSTVLFSKAAILHLQEVLGR